MTVSQGQVPELLLTGERTLPGITHENYWFRRHEAAYRWILPWCVGAVVLEAGCGEGYGAAMIGSVASRVLGLDYDVATAAHVRSRYPVIAVVRGDLQRLPFADASVEVVVNLQVIEHLWDQPGFLRECARVLRPAGTLIVSTPNRLTFSPGRASPVNPFHTRELSGDELSGLLGECFDVQRMFGLRHGARLRSVDRRWLRAQATSRAGRLTAPAMGRRLAVPGLPARGPRLAGLKAIPAGSYGSPFIDEQLKRHPAVWGAALRRDVASVGWQDFEFSEDDVDGSLDLVAVATRQCAPGISGQL